MTEKQKLAMKIGRIAKNFNVPKEAVCPNCFWVMKAVYENNGFTAPDPEKWELSYYQCINCGRNTK